MDSNYLYALDKSTVETFVENLDTAKADTSKTYQATYMSTKSSKVMETIDARTRLGTIENKEAIDTLESRIKTLEAKYANVNATPTKRLVATDKYEITPTSDSKYFSWWTNPVTGNGITVIPTSTGDGFYISRDNGDTLSSEDISNYTLETNGIAASYAAFRYSRVIFLNNTFYVLLKVTATGTLYYTTDFIHFSNIALPSDAPDTNLTSSRFIQANGNIYILKNKNLYSLSTEDNTLTFLGATNISIDYTSSYLDENDVFQNFKELYYCVANGKLYSTSNFLDYTEVETDLSPNTDSVRVENNNLIVSGYDTILYSSDASTWNTVNIPENYVNSHQGLQLYYISAEDKYYCLAMSDKTGDRSIFVWTDLSKTPTVLRSSKDTTITSGAALSYVENIQTKKFDGTMYFIARFLEDKSSSGLFCIKNGEISTVVTLSSMSTPDSFYFDSNVSGGSGDLMLCKINNRPYYIGYSTNQSYIPSTLYILENYSSAKDDDTTFIAAL